jgi:hypothetical protein
VRLSHVVTEYPTGTPFLSPGGFVYAFVVMALSVIIFDNQAAMHMAASALLLNAHFQHLEHRYAKRRAARDA